RAVGKVRPRTRSGSPGGIEKQDARHPRTEVQRLSPCLPGRISRHRGRKGEGAEQPGAGTQDENAECRRSAPSSCHDERGYEAGKVEHMGAQERRERPSQGQSQNGSQNGSQHGNSRARAEKRIRARRDRRPPDPPSPPWIGGPSVIDEVLYSLL